MFLGLHVNEDLLAPHNYLTVRRPYPGMYQLDGTEADVVHEFFAATRPFAPHLTTYLLHRSFAAEPHGHRAAQRHLYNSVLGMQRSSYDWLCPHDVDEYLVPQAPFERIDDALAECPERYSAIVMEQVIVRPRWGPDRRPRPPPLLVPDLPTCSEIVPMDHEHHGVKTFVRTDAATSLDLHVPEVVAGAQALADRRLLQYHFHGFPADTEVEPVREIPIERQVFDTTDDRPWRLLHQALGSRRAPVAGGRPGAEPTAHRR